MHPGLKWSQDATLSLNPGCRLMTGGGEVQHDHFFVTLAPNLLLNNSTIQAFL